MKKLLLSTLLLLPLLSYADPSYNVSKDNKNITTSRTTNTYKYADPSYVDAVKSNGGILEIPTAEDTTITIIFGDDDKLSNSTSSCSSNTLSFGTFNNYKTLIFESHMTPKDKSCIVNLITNNGLTHTLSFIGVPKNHKNSDIILKLIIK